ncbi:MAG: response regulator transcription factor, partial [Steroidobacteraceae bacterium]
MLLVEDEKKVSELVARALRQESYAVDVADDGIRGWELAQAYDYDLIILDLMLPGLPGEELLRRIRRRSHQVPILILTARDATEMKVQNFEAGADDYLTKPFAFSELLARLQALIRRATHVAEPTTLAVGDLSMNLLTREVFRDGQKIELQSREFALLELLMRHPGRPIT